MLENNPPRNNPPETHRDDEAGDGVSIVPGPLDSHRIDRCQGRSKSFPKRRSKK